MCISSADDTPGSGRGVSCGYSSAIKYMYMAYFRKLNINLSRLSVFQGTTQGIQSKISRNQSNHYARKL